MKFFYLVFTCLAIWLGYSSLTLAAPTRIGGLYVNTFGDPTKQAVIFVHGGPGHHSADFEVTTAQSLADLGYYVVVYDQRGQGRSDVATTVQDYSYRAYANDLMLLIQSLKLNRPVLMGHSHGGPISIKFCEFYPGVVEKLILVAAPLNFWATMEAVFANSIQALEKSGKFDEAAKLRTSRLAALNPTSSHEQKVISVGSAFMAGVQNGLYKPSVTSAHSSELSQKLKFDFTIPPENSFNPMSAFIFNENYIFLDHTPAVSRHASRIYGIYGKDDGLFDSNSLAGIEKSLHGNPSANRFHVIKEASHAVYINQQPQFLKLVQSILRESR